MRKQVTFASNETSDRHRGDGSLPSVGLNESQTASEGVCVGTQRAAAAGPEATATTGPFLKHAALTPAQRDYLHAAAACYSPAHVHTLIAQHYLNILHSWIHTGIVADRDKFVVTSHQEKYPQSQSEASSKGKQRGRTKSDAKQSHKTFFPKIPNGPSRISESKQRKMKKHTTASPRTERTLRRARIRRVTVEQEEEGASDSLSERLSSLSVGGRETDSSSDSTTLKFSC